MDTSIPGLLSEISKALEASYEPAEFALEIAREFSDLGPKNPLRKLEQGDKGRLLLLMTVYRTAFDDPKMTQRVERSALLARDAERLAARLSQELVSGSVLTEWHSLADDIRGLHTQLVAFSSTVERLLGLVGKPGQKQKNLSSCALVTVSEFVKLKTGKYHDDHLAELFQGKFLGTSKRRVLSADGIRKKRDFLQKRYPVLYASAVTTAAEFYAQTKDQARKG